MKIALMAVSILGGVALMLWGMEVIRLGIPGVGVVMIIAAFLGSIILSTFIGEKI